MKSRMLATLALPMSLVACGSDDTGAVRGYLQNLPTWMEFSPTRPDADTLIKEEKTGIQIFDGQQYSCVTTYKSLTANPDDIVIFQPDRNVLWPGALLQGKGYLGGVGSLKELAVRQRAPVKVFIDLLGENVTETVDAPDAASLQQAISGLIVKAKTAGVNPQLKASFSTTDYSNTTASSLKLGISAKFFGTTSIDSKLNVARDSSENSVIADFKASAFTVAVVAPQTPDAVFSSDFSKEKLAEQIAMGNIGPDNIPVYVSSVTYGKRFLYNQISKSSTNDITASLNASLKWAGLKADIEKHYREVLTQGKRGIVAIGGDEKQLNDAITEGMNGYFAKETAIDAWVPISYEVRSLVDGSIAKISETTDYNIRICSPVAQKQHRVELQVADSWRSATVTAEPDGRSAVGLLNVSGGSQRIDISSYVTKPTDRIVVGNTGGSRNLFESFHRSVTVNIWVDNVLMIQETSECKRCHSTDRALAFTFDNSTGRVTVVERNNN